MFIYTDCPLDSISWGPWRSVSKLWNIFISRMIEPVVPCLIQVRAYYRQLHYFNLPKSEDSMEFQIGISDCTNKKIITLLVPYNLSLFFVFVVNLYICPCGCICVWYSFYLYTDHSLQSHISTQYTSINHYFRTEFWICGNCYLLMYSYFTKGMENSDWKNHWSV